MAERPDLEYFVPILNKRLHARRIESVSVQKPIVLRVAVKGDAASLLQGQVVDKITRRGHFVVFDFVLPHLQLVISPMLAGRFAFAEEDKKKVAKLTSGKPVAAKPMAKLPRDAAVSFTFDNAETLVYRDDVQMGKVYIIERGAFDLVPGLETIGIDVLSKSFTLEALQTLAKKRRDQVRVFLMDKATIDSFGNAYADVALWEAQIHPKTMMNKLTADDLQRLHQGIVKVMREAVDTVQSRKPSIDEKLRDFLKVRNRHGEKCPRCGDTIRRAGVHGHDTFFCPTCQPETRKTGVVSWGG
jgi:formamidopyrimidine-DNA glycosylase